MRIEDVPELSERLTEMAEAIPGGKAPTKGALRVWLDVLAEFSMPDVKTILTDLPKRATKFPAPADVYRILDIRRAERIEAEALRRRDEPVLRVTEFLPMTPTGREHMAKIRRILATPRPHKRAWIEKVLEREARGDETLGSYAPALARAAKQATEPPSD